MTPGSIHPTNPLRQSVYMTSRSPVLHAKNFVGTCTAPGPGIGREGEDHSDFENGRTRTLYYEKGAPKYSTGLKFWDMVQGPVKF